VGAGRWASVPEACDATIAITSRVEPDTSRAAVYASGHEVYRDLYGRLKTAFPRA